MSKEVYNKKNISTHVKIRRYKSTLLDNGRDDNSRKTWSRTAGERREKNPEEGARAQMTRLI